jgi:flagellar biosynthesis GTPase FlhF
LKIYIVKKVNLEVHLCLGNRESRGREEPDEDDDDDEGRRREEEKTKATKKQEEEEVEEEEEKEEEEKKNKQKKKGEKEPTSTSPAVKATKPQLKRNEWRTKWRKLTNGDWWLMAQRLWNYLNDKEEISPFYDPSLLLLEQQPEECTFSKEKTGRCRNNLV